MCGAQEWKEEADAVVSQAWEEEVNAVVNAAALGAAEKELVNDEVLERILKEWGNEGRTPTIDT